MKYLLIIISILFSIPLYSQQIIEDNSGRKIKLNPDKTWEYVQGLSAMSDKDPEVLVRAYMGGRKFLDKEDKEISNKEKECMLNLMKMMINDPKIFAKSAAPYAPKLNYLYAWAKESSLVNGKITMGDYLNGVDHVIALNQISFNSGCME